MVVSEFIMVQIKECVVMTLYNDENFLVLCNIRNWLGLLLRSQFEHVYLSIMMLIIQLTQVDRARLLPEE